MFKFSVNVLNEFAEVLKSLQKLMKHEKNTLCVSVSLSICAPVNTTAPLLNHLKSSFWCQNLVLFSVFFSTNRLMIAFCCSSVHPFIRPFVRSTVLRLRCNFITKHPNKLSILLKDALKSVNCSKRSYCDFADKANQSLQCSSGKGLMKSVNFFLNNSWENSIFRLMQKMETIKQQVDLTAECLSPS